MVEHRRRITSNLESPSVVYDTVRGFETTMRLDWSVGQEGHTTTDVLHSRHENTSTCLPII